MWQICDIVGLIFTVANGQILKNNPTIWSHCSQLTQLADKVPYILLLKSSLARLPIEPPSPFHLPKWPNVFFNQEKQVLPFELQIKLHYVGGSKSVALREDLGHLMHFCGIELLFSFTRCLSFSARSILIWKPTTFTTPTSQIHQKKFFNSLLSTPGNVTRFGEISPIWQNLLSLWQYFEGIFSIWQSYETALVNLVCHWANFRTQL